MKVAVRRISSATSTSAPGAAGIPPTSTMSAPSAMTWSTRAIAARSSQVRPGRKNESGVLLTIPMINGCDGGNAQCPRRSIPWARGPCVSVMAGRACGRSLGHRDWPRYLVSLAALVPHKLLQLGLGGERVRTTRPSAAGHYHELGCHEGQVMIGLMPVGARAEVDLGDSIEPVAGHGVHQRRQFDAVADRDGQ